MEKLKPILLGLKKHHFWIVCVVAVGVVLTGLYLAFGDFEESFKKNTGLVRAQFTALETIQKKDQPPNKLAGETWPKEAEKKSRTLRDELLAAARKLQIGQELEWPKKLGADFQAKAREQGRGGKLPADMVDKWQKNLPAELDGLKEMANPPLRAKEGGVAAREGGLQWGENAFEQFRDQFVGKDAQGPALFDAQEKIWVAQSVMRCIAATNEGATDNYNLPVSMIEMFDVGPAAARERPLRVADVPGGPPVAPPPPPPAAGAVPGAPAAIPGVAAGGPAGAAAKAAPPPAPPAAPTVPAARPVLGLRAYPIRLRMKMNPAMLGKLLSSMVNQKTLIIVDDVYFENEMKVVLKGGPPVAPPAPAAAAAAGPAGPNVAAAPGFGVGAAPGVAPVAGRPPGAPGGQAAPGPAAPHAPEAHAGDAGKAQLVQVPRGAVVEIFATAYFVDPKEVEGIKVAILQAEAGSGAGSAFASTAALAIIDRGRYRGRI